jgi:DNA processing protein
MMNRTILHLSLIPGVGPAVLAKIARVLPCERFDELYRWSMQDFMYRIGISQQSSQAIVEGLLDTKVLHEEIRLCEKHAVRIVTIDQQEYPELLRSTHLPPIVLYWQGNSLNVVEHSIAMVGSRKASKYGQRAIDSMAPVLVEAGWTIVSGGAIGADTMVHQATLQAEGKTVAVIGAGLLCPYPRSNKKLFETIIEQGGIVMSPFPVTMEALPGNFPARNRIISGLSRATVVIQAAEKSGALITALFALEQGREVCVLPGAFDDPLSAGCHALVREGASLVTSAADILKAIGLEITQSNIIKNNTKEKLKDPLLEACVMPQTFDDLCLVLGYDETYLQERLVALQIEGVLEQDVMGRWYSVI